jgi:LysR family nitrogen assimilation transcriptional regulator
MDLLTLRYFVAIVRYRSVSKAAVALGIVQPALTRRIKLLEEQLGVELLARHRRGVEPTEAGLIVLERAEVMLHMAQQLVDEAKSHGAEPIGQARFAFPPAVSILVIGKVLSECAARYPRISLYLQEDYSPAVRDGLLSGRLDLGVASTGMQHPDLVGQPLFRETISLVGAPRIWPFQSLCLRPAELDNLPLVLGSSMRQVVEELRSRVTFNLRVVAEVDSYSVLMEAIRAGAGFGVCPSSVVAREVEEQQFVGAIIEGFEIERTLYHNRSRPLNRASVALYNLINDEVWRLATAPPQQFLNFEIFGKMSL